MKKTLAFFVLLAAVFAKPASAAPIYDTSLESPDANPATPASYFGGGNVNAHFAVTRDDGTELGLQAIVRFIGPAPVVGDDYTVSTGTSGGKALWTYAFSIDTQPNGVGTATLSDFTYSLTLTDLVTSQSNSYDPVTDLGDNATFGSSGAQNAESFSFAGLGSPNFDPNSTDTYQITLAEFSGGIQVSSDSILVSPEVVPEVDLRHGPVPLVFAAVCFMLLGDSRRKR